MDGVLLSEAYQYHKELIHIYKNMSEAELIKIVNNDAYQLAYIENQTPTICKAAIKKDVKSLRFVMDMTEDICIYAIEAEIKHLKEREERFIANNISKRYMDMFVYLSTKSNVVKLIPLKFLKAKEFQQLLIDHGKFNWLEQCKQELERDV